MKKILIVTPRYPYPVIGGDRLRIYKICELLAQRYELTLLSLCQSEAEMKMPAMDDGIFQHIEKLYLPRWRSLLNCVMALPGARPLQVAYFAHPEIGVRARDLMASHDAIFVHLVRLADVANGIEKTSFLELTDAISLNYERVKALRVASRDLRVRIFSFEANRIKRYEREVVQKFSHAFCVSDVDRQFLLLQGGSAKENITVSANGVDATHMPFQLIRASRELVFVGNMLSLQNLDAANYLAEDILPLVRQAFKDVTVRVVGRISSRSARKLSRTPGVTVTGEVKSIADATSSGGVGMCPVRMGAGVQNKILEYMALGLPTVTTSLGLEGLSANPGEHILVADDPASIAQATISLLANQDKAQQMAKCARSLVEANYSWSGALSPLDSVVRELLADS